MKRQISLRISDRTAEQMEQLKRIHGTATEVVTVAVNRYHEEMMMKGKVVERITVEFSEDSLFGGDDPEEAGIDTQASIANFQESLENYISHDYPGATVTVCCTINDRIIIDSQPESEHPEVPWVGELVSKCWHGDDWLVHL